MMSRGSSRRYAANVADLTWIRDRADVLFAVALAALFVTQAMIVRSPGGGFAVATVGSGEVVALVTGVAFTLSLAWRRLLPLVPLALAFVALAAAGGASPDTSVAIIIALVATTYTVGAWSGHRTALVGALGVGALAGFVVLLDADDTIEPGDVAVGMLLVMGPWVAGVGLRNLRARTARLEAETTRLEAERDAQVRAAVESERTRVARELHDVVAHAISIIVLQARGARRSLPEDPALTNEALEVIEKTGGQALGEMRRLVAVLRSPEEPAPLSPRPGLDDLARLAARFDEAGLPVTITVEGAPIDIPRGLDLAAYRIIQESLTNTLHHAGSATASVRVRYGNDELVVEVADDGRGLIGHERPALAGSSMGLVGMRERIELYDGSFSAGPGADGGYVVTARIPLDRER